MKKIVYIIFENFEEIESIVPTDLLRRAGAKVDVVTLNYERETTGRSQIKIIADKILNGIEYDFDMLAISGGSGVFDVIKNNNLLSLIRDSHKANKQIAAICAAPLILQEAGVLECKKCTGHSSIIEKLGDSYEDKACVHSENIITSQGAGTAFEFAFELIETLFGVEKVEEVAKSICYKF